MIKMVIADSRNVLKTMVVSGVVMVGAFLSGHVSHASGLLGDGSLQAHLGLTSTDQWSSSTASSVANTDGSLRSNLALQLNLQSNLRLDGDNTGTVDVSAAGNDQSPIWVGGQAKTNADAVEDAKGKANLGAGLTVRANTSAHTVTKVPTNTNTPANAGMTVSTTTNTSANVGTKVSTNTNTSANVGTAVSLSEPEANGNLATAADVALKTNLSSASTPIAATTDHAAPAKQIALSAKGNATLDSDTPVGSAGAGKPDGVHANAVVNVKLGSHSGNMERQSVWLWLKANLMANGRLWAMDRLLSNNQLGTTASLKANGGLWLDRLFDIRTDGKSNDTMNGNAALAVNAWLKQMADADLMSRTTIQDKLDLGSRLAASLKQKGTVGSKTDLNAMDQLGSSLNLR